MNDSEIKEEIQKEVRMTINWGLTTVVFIIVQTAGIFWWASGIDEKVKQDQIQLESMQQQHQEFITRIQLTDILGQRDVQIANILTSVQRIEAKLDNK